MLSPAPTVSLDKRSAWRSMKSSEEWKKALKHACKTHWLFFLFHWSYLSVCVFFHLSLSYVNSVVFVFKPAQVFFSWTPGCCWNCSRLDLADLYSWANAVHTTVACLLACPTQLEFDLTPRKFAYIASFGFLNLRHYFSTTSISYRPFSDDQFGSHGSIYLTKVSQCRSNGSPVNFGMNSSGVKCKFDTCKMAANVPSTLEWNLSLMGLVQSIFSSLFAHNLVK